MNDYEVIVKVSSFFIGSLGSLGLPYRRPYAQNGLALAALNRLAPSKSYRYLSQSYSLVRLTFDAGRSQPSIGRPHS